MTKIGFGGKNIIDIIKYRYLWFTISGILIIPCICFMIYLTATLPTHSPVRLGIDFTGGTFLQYGFAKKMDTKDIAEIRKILAEVGQDNAIIQPQEAADILGALKDNKKTESSVDDKMNSDETTDENKSDANEDKPANEDTVKDNPDEKPSSGVQKDENNEEKAALNKDEKDNEKTSEDKSSDKTSDKTVDKKSDAKTAQKKNDNEKDESAKESKADESDKVAENKKETDSNNSENKEVKENPSGVDNPFAGTGDDSDVTTKSLDASKVKTVVSIRVKFLNAKEVKKINALLKEKFGDFSIIQVSAIGPSLGKELLHNAMMALLLVFAGIVIYLTVRFQLDYAVCALITLFHDAIFVIGMFALFGILFQTEVDSLFVTAVLTVIGFSVHDTIVVFDRIRENARFLSKKKTFNEICNDSVNQTIARSVNTSLTTIFVLLCLFFFGGVTTKDFVLAMTLGIAVGTYSSIFVASVILAFWRDINAPKKKKRKVST